MMMKKKKEREKKNIENIVTFRKSQIVIELFSSFFVWLSILFIAAY